MRRTLLLAVFLVAVVTSCARQRPDLLEVAAMLDDWYDAADKGDGQRYFSCFADDAIFLGADPEERWTVAEFRARYESFFDGHHAWTYVPKERHVLFSKNHETGWFDEKLSSPKYGLLRGTGVVIRARGKWKIEHYSLTFLIPNAATKKVMEVLKTPG
jgi:hypothetical protein